MKHFPVFPGHFTPCEDHLGEEKTADVKTQKFKVVHFLSLPGFIIVQSVITVPLVHAVVQLRPTPEGEAVCTTLIQGPPCSDSRGEEGLLLDTLLPSINRKECLLS